MVALLEDRRGISTALRTGAYAQAALVPASPWLDAMVPTPPQIQPQKNGRLLIVASPGKAAAHFAIWRKFGASWKFTVQSASEPEVEGQDAEAIVVSSVDRLGNESSRVTWTPVPKPAPKP
jgi:hypothetical protein